MRGRKGWMGWHSYVEMVLAEQIGLVYLDCILRIAKFRFTLYIRLKNKCNGSSNSIVIIIIIWRGFEALLQITEKLQPFGPESTGQKT